MSTDAELLRRYIQERSETAFTELVQRHLNLVYFAALRQVGGDAHRARDVAQTVFTDLARKAASLADRVTLTGWLHTSTRFAATKARRADTSRKYYEQEAITMNALLHESDPATEWERLRPMIDDVIHELSESDRDAVLLRFFEDRSFTEIGTALRLSEDAARMRVDRALEKLRLQLGRRGVTSTGAALAGAFASQAGAATPAGLAQAITGAALAGAASGIAGISAGIFMSMKTTVIISVAIAAVGSTIYQWNQAFRTQSELTVLKIERDGLREQLEAEKQRASRATRDVATLRGEVELLKTKTAVAPPPKVGASVAADAAQQSAVRDGITNNLKQIAAARDQFELENGRAPTSIDELVGPDKLIKRLVVVSGESYSGLSMERGQTLAVTSAEGVVASYDRQSDAPSRTASVDTIRTKAQVLAARRANELGQKMGPALERAIAAYKTAHNDQTAPNSEAYAPYFETPQEGADFVEFLEAIKVARSK